MSSFMTVLLPEWKTDFHLFETTALHTSLSLHLELKQACKSLRPKSKQSVNNCECTFVTYKSYLTTLKPDCMYCLSSISKALTNIVVKVAVRV